MANTENVPQPTGKTTRYWFANGYRQAMLDLLIKLDEEGEDAAIQWIKDNS